MNNESQKIAVIIGAGPAGLSAAYALAKSGKVRPLVFETSAGPGGLAKTVNYKGNRLDIGGHRFFTKSQVVKDFWQEIMPSFMKRPRQSRIFFAGKFFNYPLTIDFATLKNLGAGRLFKIFWTYLLIKIKPIKPEKSLADFFINRFGRELYQTFFKSYTEKLWGKSCEEISAEWGGQRVKGLSVTKVIKEAFGRLFKNKANQVKETSLINEFIYPKLGPGQFWEATATAVKNLGGEIYYNQAVIGLNRETDYLIDIKIKDKLNGLERAVKADFFLSSMPIKDLLNCLDNVPLEIATIAKNLPYRDFLTVGLLVKELKIKNIDKSEIKDNWFYIQDPRVNLGRLQIFNNWSPYLIKDQNNFWLGLEYFGNDQQGIFGLNDQEFAIMAIKELVQIGFIDETAVLDSVVVREAKAYPAYYGAYAQFPELRTYLDQINNLFLIGRNGLHRYNNMDHSTLTAFAAVDNILNGLTTKANIWSVNAEAEYHE